MLGCPGRPGEESSPRLVSWAEGWPMGLVWAPMGGDGVQSFQRCPDVPAPCVPAVAANTAPIFESNMSAVSLPEDLPVGEYLCPARTKPSPQRGPGGPPWACSPSLQLHSTSRGKDGPKGVCTRSFFFSAFRSKTLTRHQIIKTHPKRTPLLFPISFRLSDFPREKVSIWYHYFSSLSLAHLPPSLAFFFFFLNRQQTGGSEPFTDTSHQKSTPLLCFYCLCTVTFHLWRVRQVFHVHNNLKFASKVNVFT